MGRRGAQGAKNKGSSARAGNGAGRRSDGSLSPLPAIDERRASSGTESPPRRSSLAPFPASPEDSAERHRRLSSLRRLSNVDDGEEPPIYGTPEKQDQVEKSKTNRTSIDYLEDEGQGDPDLYYAMCTALIVTATVAAVAYVTRSKKHVIAATLVVPGLLLLVCAAKFAEIVYLELGLWAQSRPFLRSALRAARKLLHNGTWAATWIIKAAMCAAIVAMSKEVLVFMAGPAEGGQKVVVAVAALLAMSPAVALVLTQGDR